MRLLVVSHTPHYRRGKVFAGWGPTVREIDQLATLFTEVTHVAPLHADPAPESALEYGSGRVRLVPVPPAGGPRLLQKLAIALAAPRYIGTILREARRCEIVHVRCPANIGLFAVLLLIALRRPERRWIKYAGDWGRRAGEPWSYALQRRLLTGTLHRAVVTVNGTWPGQPPHVLSFANPCLTDEELSEGKRAAARKSLGSPVKLLFVGRLDEAKGAGRVLEILALLRRQGVAARARIVGNGASRGALERRAAELSVADSAEFLGPLSRPSLSPLYADSDIQLLPSRSSEGWPKVLSEGMAYGVVPVASDVGSIPEFLRSLRVGQALPADDIAGFAAAVVAYAQDPAAWKEESRRGVLGAERFGYSRYLADVRRILDIGE